MTKNNKRWLALGFVALVTGDFLVFVHPEPRGVSKYQRDQIAESLMILRFKDTTYQRRLWDVRRRASLVRMDSLARLASSVFTERDTMIGYVRRAYGCEQWLLMSKYGTAPYLRALGRMNDSIERATGKSPQERDERMMTAPGPEFELGWDACGPTADTLPVLPDSVSEEPEQGNWPRPRVREHPIALPIPKNPYFTPSSR